MYSRLMKGTVVAFATLVAALFLGIASDGSVAEIESGQPGLRTMPVKPEQSIIPPGYDRRFIEVKFQDDLDIGISSVGAPIDRSGRTLRSRAASDFLAQTTFAGGRWQRLSPLGEPDVDLLVARAELNLNRDIADLNNYFVLSVPTGAPTEAWLDLLNALPEVEIALAMPLPMPAPLPPNLQPSQGYLNNAPGGIGAGAAWAMPGGTGAPTVGAPVAVCDFEYSVFAHADLPGIGLLVPPTWIPSDPYSDDNHGTAVMGELLSLSNGWGTTGASHGVAGYFAPTNFTVPGWQIGAAMLNALSTLGPGDVFLIEQQMAGPNYTGIPAGSQIGLVPIEWWASWYYTVITVVGNGIHVVEAAGNGNEDLDQAVYGAGHAPFQPANNSGAIIVGAGAVPGGSDTDRSRLSGSNWGSNYGSRVDLQGWGENVVTTGYNDLYAAEGKSYWYTGTFGGTSGASPNVASAVAILESIYESASAGLPMPPGQMRNLLVATGSAQQAGSNPVSQNIGPRPDLGYAIQALPLAPDTCEYYKAPFVDYAPSGVPDFDQKQDNWRSPITTTWSHCGPVALANCLWWFDSKFEPSPVNPTPFWPGPSNPGPNDGYGLLPSFNPGIWDDHDTSNVMPFVDSLAFYCNTNPPGRSGTYVYDLAFGAQNWLAKVGLGADYTINVFPVDPTWGFEQLRAEVLRSQNVILLLGFWQEFAGGVCERVGGHYVTVAGTCPNPADSAICISDPYFDGNEGEPPAGSAHGSSIHNDARHVSGPHGTMHHDRYNLTLSPCQPFVQPFFQLELVNYPVNPLNVGTFLKQNDYDTSLVPVPPQPGFPMHTLIEYAVVICPAEAPAAPNHYKTWGLEPLPVDITVDVEDQFMTDALRLSARDFLSNPTRKDTFSIISPNDHLVWYRASGRDTLLRVEFDNQFGLDTVIIDSVTHLLVPARKEPHPAPGASLGHYKAYRIRGGQSFPRVTELQDQFDLQQPEFIDSLKPVYFLTPATKNGEPIYDSVTHYVAYDLTPKRSQPQIRLTEDQFGATDVLVLQSELLLVPSVKLSFTPVTDTIPGDDPCWYFKPGYPEYAPNGVPDFDQKQDNWKTPGTPQWSWCGPTALANCFWWFDSKFDSIDLVTAYVAAGDHAPENVPPLIGALATCMNTDLIIQGTDVHQMEQCIDDWLAANLLAAYFEETTYKAPDFFFIEEEIKRSQNVILLLGFWELDPTGIWQRLGGHYVTCAGVCSESLWVAISDPYYDLAEGNPPGGPPHAATLHNDAALVSGPHGSIAHDRYRASLASPSPGGSWWLPDYPIGSDPVGLDNFAFQNCPEEYQPFQGQYAGGIVHTEVEYAVVVCPTDSDNDSIPDLIDNCPNNYNPAQEDADGDLVGDSCDNCINNYNPAQEDSDGDLVGDSCEVTIPPGDDSCWYYKPGYPDYAPNGVPDFDQKQDSWFDPASGQWTWCGPTALANCFWWFDSKFDTTNLVRSYGTWSDHDPLNVPPLISALATCMNTDLFLLGTNVHWMEQCIDDWLLAAGLQNNYVENTYKAPNFIFIEDEIKRSQNVILLLGFWEQDPASLLWHRIGGHYVTCAGVCSESLWVAISDPWYDWAEGGAAVHLPAVHNDAALISGPHGTNWHDRYRIDTLSPSPGGSWWIPEYPGAVDPDFLDNFQFQNCPDEFGSQQGTWMGGDVHTEIEYAVVVCPDSCLVKKTGDVNTDGVITSADIIYLVNYVFKGGPKPLPCEAAGDVTCDKVVTSADIIYLVNYVFKGGPPPCDVCTLIRSGDWTCP